MSKDNRNFKIVGCSAKDIIGKTYKSDTPLNACRKIASKLSLHDVNIMLKETTRTSSKKLYSYNVSKKNGKHAIRKLVGGVGENAAAPSQGQPLTAQPLANAPTVIQNRGTELVRQAQELQKVDLETIIKTPEKQYETNIPSGGRPTDGSKFVIITYWWGRGNFNKNLQYPCPEDLSPGEAIEDYQNKPRYKPREKFENMIDTWKNTIAGMGCYYYSQEYPEFAKPGMYQMAINAKPLFIKKALEDCSALGFKGVVYIDGDMSVNTYPAIFDLDDIDFMARGWNIDPRSSADFREDKICYDPFTFETSGGIMYFGNTVYARQLLDIWKIASAKKINQGKADDRIISLMFNALRLYIPYNVIELPIEYLWLTDIYGEKVTPSGVTEEYAKKGHVVYNYVRDNSGKRRLTDKQDRSGDIIFEHPACLTGEERAADQGASSNRTPPFYDTLVEDKIDCSRHGGVFYEFVYFYNGQNTSTNQQALASYKKYLEYMDSVVLPDPNPDQLPPFYVVPYDNTYGELQDIVKTNLDNLGKSLEEVLNNGLEPNVNENDMTNVFVTVQGKGGQDATDIKMILSNLMKGYDVLYMPSEYKVANSRPINVNNARMFGGSDLSQVAEFMKKNVPVGCEFVSFVSDPDEYQPDFDFTKPMYFSHRSRMLRHVLLMSGSLKQSISDVIDLKGNKKIVEVGFNDIFRSSFIFLTRIRCKWLDSSDITSGEKCCKCPA